MPVLEDSGMTGRITWLGRVTESTEGIRSERLSAVEARFAGVEGEVHGGLTRPACVRVKHLYPEGTEIRNARQFSILSAEETAAIAAELELEVLEPEWLGASMVIEGIGDFSHVPPSSRLQTEAGTTLVIDMLNAPCNWPGKEIEKDRPGHGKAFRRAAEGRRGVTASVEREGPLKLGDTLRLFVPTQRAWAGGPG